MENDRYVKRVAFNLRRMYVRAPFLSACQGGERIETKGEKRKLSLIISD